MKLNIFRNWDDGNVTAGYTTGCGGLFRYQNPLDTENYEALSKVFHMTAGQMVRVHQSHTDNILIVGAESGGEGILKKELDEDYDGILTNTGGLILCLVSADCVPVFLYDRAKGVIGLVHSGRAGTIKEIAAKAVLRMEREYASDPSELRCILGPYLCAAHHEVGPADAEPFYERFSPEECSRFLKYKGGRVYVDMGTAITISLVRCGLAAEHIHDSGLCTYEHKELYSWRRDHDPNAQLLSFVLMKRY